MKLIEYIKKMQSKYNISNTEIIEEFNDNHISISKGAFSHKLNGERKITKKEADILRQVFGMSSAEEKLFNELYRIYDMGEENYEEIICVQKYIESLSELKTPVIPHEIINLDDVHSISDEDTLSKVIFTVIRKIWGKGKLKILCQPEYKSLSDMLLYFFSGINSDTEQIVCFNNSSKSINNLYNIQCIKVLNNLVIRNTEYSVRYYYDDVFSHINCFSLFPFMVIAGEYAVLISADYKSGLLIHEEDIIFGLNNEFNKQYAHSQELFEIIEDEAKYMEICTLCEKESQKQFYTLQYHPCVIFAGNMDIAKSHIKDGFPGKQEILNMYSQRLVNLNDSNFCHIYNEEGMADFMNTGRTSDLSENMFTPMSFVERKMIEEKIKHSDQNHQSCKLSSDVIKIPKMLTIVCYDNNNILVGYKNSEHSEQRFLLKERSIYKSILAFFKYLQEEGMANS